MTTSIKEDVKKEVIEHVNKGIDASSTPPPLVNITENVEDYANAYIALLTKYANNYLTDIEKDLENLQNVISCHMELPN